MTEMRPMSAHPGVQSKQSMLSKPEVVVHNEPRPKTGLTVRSRVLKSNSTAFNNWLRRGNDFNYHLKKQSRDYKSVETFNLRPGCRVTKSASQLRVKMDPDEFFKPKVPKMTAVEMPVREMESLIRDLQEQVKYLTVYLEEERLHHAGTKKRAKVDLQNAKAEMEHLHEEEIEKMVNKHHEFIEGIKRDHNDHVEEIEDQLRRQYKALEKDYKLLQASFRNYKSKVSEDMEEKWSIKRREFDWEKQKSVDNAVETTQKTMEERFNKERISIRSEYKELMHQMIADQRLEMEDFMRKMSDGKSSIEDLKARADLVDKLEKELTDTKEALQAAQKEIRELNLEFTETRSKLLVYENQFEDKVNAVEDKYKKRIDDLINEVSDFRMLLIKKAETLYLERAAADELQQKWTEFTKQKFQNRIFLTQKNQSSSRYDAGEDASTKPKIPEQSEAVKEVSQVESKASHDVPKSSEMSEEAPSLSNINTTHLPLSVCRKNGKTISHTLDAPPKKHQSAKKEQVSSGTAMDISATKAGTDKIRPRLHLSTVSLLETADLPYISAEDYQSRGHHTSRPSSPDVIY